MQDRKTPFTLAQIVQTSYHYVNKTGIYSLALKDWRKKRLADQTWTIFKQVFAEEYHNLLEETKVASEDSGFNSENSMQDIGGAPKHLVLAVEANKEISTNLTEAVKALTRKNTLLTTQLSDVMRINLVMDKTINLKATQKPEYKRLAEKENRKAAFEKNLDRDG